MLSIINASLTKFVTRPQPLRQSFQLLHVSAINPAARKGTRMKAQKKKIKAQIEEKKWAPKDKKKSLIFVDRHTKWDDSYKSEPIDNVYVAKYHRLASYNIADVIAMHRETHHPTMHNVPNAPLNLQIELNMKGQKQTRFVGNFIKLAHIQYPFEHGEERKILAFVKTEEQRQAATEAGATTVGGTDLIKLVQKGEVDLNLYPYVVAHPEIMPELIALRGLLKKKFPTPKTETLGADVRTLVQNCMSGINYSAIKDDNQQDFALIDTCIGTLDMPVEHLQANFDALLSSVNEMRPNRAGKFITRIFVTSPPSREIFRIDPKSFPFEDYDRIAPVKGKKGTGKAQAVEVGEESDDDEEKEKETNEDDAKVEAKQ